MQQFFSFLLRLLVIVHVSVLYVIYNNERNRLQQIITLEKLGVRNVWYFCSSEEIFIGFHVSAWFKTGCISKLHGFCVNEHILTAVILSLPEFHLPLWRTAGKDTLLAALACYASVDQRLREFLSVQTQLLERLRIKTKAVKNWLGIQVWTMCEKKVAVSQGRWFYSTTRENFSTTSFSRSCEKYSCFWAKLFTAF